MREEGGAYSKGCLFDILAGGGALLGRRCLLECGHREIRYTSVNPNFFLMINWGIKRGIQIVNNAFYFGQKRNPIKWPLKINPILPVT